MANLEIGGAVFYEKGAQYLGEMELSIRSEWTLIDKEQAIKIIDHLKQQFNL